MAIREGFRWLKRPPLGSQVDLAHPSAAGLLGFWLFNEDGGTPFNLMPSGLQLPLVGSPTWTSGSDGPALKFNGTTQCLEVVKPIVTAPPFTFAARATYPTALPSASEYLVSVSLGSGGASNSSFGLLVRGGVAGKPISVLSDNAATSGVAQAALGPTVGVPFTATAVVWSSTLRNAYFNGGSKGTNGTSVTTPTGLTTTDIAAIWFSGTRQSFFSGQMEYLKVWGRGQNDDFINEDAKNPYAAVLAPTHRRWFVPAGGAASFSISESALPANHGAGTVVIHAVLSGGTWTGAESISVSGVTGWAFSSKTLVDSTHYTITLTCPAAATPPLGATGTLTVTIGALNATTTIGTPTLAISPTSGLDGTTPTLTLTGGNTLWTTETAATLFSETGGTGASLATPSVSSNTSATAVLTVGTAPGTETITDNSTGATATFTALSATLTCGPTCTVTSTTARISFRASSACTVTVKYSTNPTLSGGTTTGGVSVTSTTDFTGHIDITGLTANTTYSYTVLLDGVDQLAATYPTLKTFPTAPTAFSFAFGSCTGHTSGENQGADTIFSVLPAGLAFLLHIGDTIYADADLPASSTLADFRTHHQLAMNGDPANFCANWQAIRRKIPCFTIWDDHELYNNFDQGTGDPKYAPAKQAFQEYHAQANPDPLTAGELYYAFNFADVGFFVCDLRSFRSPDANTDNASKVMLGATQLAALKNWLLTNASTYTFKFIVSSDSAAGYTNEGNDSWGGADDGTQQPNGGNGFRTDRNALWDWIDQNNIQGVVWIAGDLHWAGSFKTTYGTKNGYTRPRYEFLSSPYNQVNITKTTRAPDATNGPIFWDYDAGVNAGIVSVDTTAHPPTVSFQLYGASGTLGSGFLTSLDVQKINNGIMQQTLSGMGCGA